MRNGAVLARLLLKPAKSDGASRKACLKATGVVTPRPTTLSSVRPTNSHGLRIERYLSEGYTVSGGCGASATQQELQAMQTNFYAQQIQEQNQNFNENQAILKQLTGVFSPIFAQGPSQLGYSTAELNDLNSLATTGVGSDYAAAQKALALQEGASGGGNSFVPSGANQEQRAQLAESAAGQESSDLLNINQADWQQGLSNFDLAAQALSGVAAQENPIGYSQAATGAGSAASTTAQEVTSANQSWMQLAAGALGAAGGALGGGSLGQLVNPKS
jgi:hypothetical protein